jgi:hypothetical protein
MILVLIRVASSEENCGLLKNVEQRGWSELTRPLGTVKLDLEAPSPPIESSRNGGSSLYRYFAEFAVVVRVNEETANTIQIELSTMRSFGCGSVQPSRLQITNLWKIQN